MGLIPDETISEIRGRADLVAIIGRHVELRKAGRNHKGLCPFHSEKSPSFTVSGDKGFFYCFGCQQKGDVFSFLMEYEGKSFIEAAESLAAQLGIAIPTTGRDPAAARLERSERGQMLRITELAAAFYREALRGPEGTGARAYLEERGIGEESASHFRLGYAPAGWDALSVHLEAAGAPRRLAESAGLIVARERGSGYYDRFRDRLMCPIFEANGEIVGFSGRQLSEDEARPGAKYINSPENSIFKKSKLLYGLHQARDGFRAAGRALLVEGNFDVVSLHQAGFPEAIAPLGTALSDDQAAILRRLVGEVVLLYDGDRAGRAATLKALKTLSSASVAVRIATLAPGDDPDSLVSRGGAAALRDVLSRTQPGVEYFIHEVWSRADRSARGRAEALSEAAHVLRTIADATERDFAVGTLSRALDIDEATLRRGLRRALESNSRSGTRAEKDAGDGPLEVAAGKKSVHPIPAELAPPDRWQLDILAILARVSRASRNCRGARRFFLLDGFPASRHVLRRARWSADSVGDLGHPYRRSCSRRFLSQPPRTRSNPPRSGKEPHRSAETSSRRTTAPRARGPASRRRRPRGDSSCVKF